MKFKLNDGIVDIPTTWSQVKFRGFVELARQKDTMTLKNETFKAISIFTGIDEGIVATAKIKNFDMVATALGFMKVDMKMNLPYTILGLKVPQNIEAEAAARYGDIQEIIAKFKEGDDVSNLSNYPLIVATYLAPSPYNFQEAEQIAERLWDAPCGEVMATGNFILRKFSLSKRTIPSSFLPVVILLNRWRRAMTDSIRRLVFPILYGIWRR